MNHLNTLKVVAVLLLGAQLTGCATMFGRQQDEQSVFFDSNIPDVEVNCSGRKIKTPGSIPLRQSANHACTAEKEGFQRKAFQIRSGTSWSGFAVSTALNTAAWGWWTLGIGTGIGWLVDFPSGAMKNLKEDHVELRLNPVRENQAKGSTIWKK